MRKILNLFRYDQPLLYTYDKMKETYYRKFLTNEFVLKKQFKKRLGRKLNLKSPVNYNDKLQWLKLNWYDSYATKCADKYEVRKVVEDSIGAQYLNPILAVYELIEEIDIEKLPTSFVLKGTHGSGFNIICRNKNHINWKKEFKKMNRWLRTNYYWYNREWVYKDIKPRIICEEYIEQKDSEELRDYRFFCFNGVPRFISVDLSINDKEKTRRNLYDMSWNLLDGEITYPKEKFININKPKSLDEMVQLSKKLSKSFPHARVDFYEINDRPIFGEITFFHQSGMGVFNPPEFETKVGNYLELPKS